VKPSQLPGYRTEAEQASFLGKTDRTLKRWRAHRIGPPVTFVGETPYYSIGGTERWLKSQEIDWSERRRRGRR
jgi:hypothetical protein